MEDHCDEQNKSSFKQNQEKDRFGARNCTFAPKKGKFAFGSRKVCPVSYQEVVEVSELS